VGGNWFKAVSADWLPDGRMLVLTQSGQVHLANPDTGTTSLHFTVPSVDSSGERGALDLVVAPDFVVTREFFVYYSHTTNGRLHIGKFVLNENGATTRTSQQVIWRNPGPTHSQFSAYHVGGSLQFGPDGRLYLGVGDGTHAPNSQSMSTVFGKILRINRDGSIPTDNPFYDAGDPSNIDEIWAYGLRNPFRMAFDKATGKLWVGDVGGNSDATAYEEVNVVGAGQNFGWPLCEGPLTGPKAGAECPAGQGIVGPVHVYTHTIGGGCCSNRSITGGEIYRDDDYPFAHTTYLHSDYATGEFTWVTIDDATTTKLGTGPWEAAPLRPHYP
jgi:glucose/arabinose dehydrogenase